MARTDSNALARFFLAGLFLFSAVLAPGRAKAQDLTQFWPEVDAHVKLTPRVGLFFIAALSSDQDTRQIQGDFGPNLDISTKPILRPWLRNFHPEKSKFLTLRIGYRYLPTLKGEGSNENRPILELTGRFDIWWKVLLSDRNRFDFRFVEGKDFSWRYRNRLSLEKNFSLRGYTFTPYTRGEFYYDSQAGKIAKNALTIGSTFPMTKHTEFEVYYEDQRDSASSPNYHTRGAGVVLGLYF